MTARGAAVHRPGGPMARSRANPPAWSSGDTQLPNGASTSTGGAYSSTKNKVVITAYGSAKLRAYPQGSTGGPGTVIATSPVSMTGNGYCLNLVAVPPDTYSGGWIAYGLGLAIG